MSSRWVAIVPGILVAALIWALFWTLLVPELE